MCAAGVPAGACARSSATPIITSGLATKYTMRVGEQLVLPCATTGYPKPSVRWTYTTGGRMVTSENGNLIIPSLTAVQFEQNVTCTAVNRVGTASQTALVTQEIGSWQPISCPPATSIAGSCLISVTRVCVPTGTRCSGPITTDLDCCPTTVPPTTAPTTLPDTTPAPTTTPTAQPPTTSIPITTTAAQPPTTTARSSTTSSTSQAPTTTTQEIRSTAASPRPPPPSTATSHQETSPRSPPPPSPSTSGQPITSSSSPPATTTTGQAGSTVASSTDSSTLYIAVGAAAGGVVLILLLISILVCRHRRGPKQSQSATALFTKSQLDTSGNVVLTNKMPAGGDGMDGGSVRYVEPGTGLRREDSMTPNVKYNVVDQQGNTESGPMYNEIPSNPSTAVRYVSREDSNESYIDMNHKAAYYDRPSPMPAQKEAHDKSNPDYDSANYILSGGVEGPAVIKPVALNPGTMATDMMNYEVTTGKRKDTANFYEVHG